MALHTQEKKRKEYPGNFTLYPGYNDKFLIWYDDKDKCYKVTHYSKWAFRGRYSLHGTRSFTETGKECIRRNEWTYTGKGKNFKTEIDALNFAKNKAKERNMPDAVFLLQLGLA